MEAGLIEENCLNGSWIDENSRHIADTEAVLIKEYCLDGSWLDKNSIV